MDMYRSIANDSIGWIEDDFRSSHSIPPPPRRRYHTHSTSRSIRTRHRAGTPRRTPHTYRRGTSKTAASGRLVASLLEPAEARVLLPVHQVDCPHGQLHKALPPPPP